jgi:hypothetical protein
MLKISVDCFFYDLRISLIIKSNFALLILGLIEVIIKINFLIVQINHMNLVIC